MRRSIFIIPLFLTLPSGSAFADECSDFLPYAQGIEILNEDHTHDQATASSLVSLIRQLRQDADREHASGNGSYGIAKGSADWGRESTKLSQSEALLNTTGEASSRAQDSIFKYAKTLSDRKAELFTQCINSKGAHYTVVPYEDSATVALGIELVAVVLDGPKLKVNNIVTSNSIKCPESLKSSEIAAGARQWFECKRETGKAGTITIGSNYGVSGSNDILKIPPIDNQKAHIELRNYDLHWCGATGCDTTDKLLMWNISSSSPSCSYFPLRQFLKSNEELLLDYPAKLTVKTQVGSLPWATVHPINLSALTVDKMQLCGYRDPPFDDWPKSEFLLTLTYPVLVRD